MIKVDEKSKVYTYRRFMRDGSTQEIRAVVRSRSANRKTRKTVRKHS